MQSALPFPLRISELLIVVCLVSCGTQSLNQRKSSNTSKASPTQDSGETQRDANTAQGSSAEEDLGEEVTVAAPGSSSVSGTRIAGRFGGSSGGPVAVDEAIAIGADVLGGYLQVPVSDTYALTKPIYADFPEDPAGKRQIRLQIPVSASLLTSDFDDEHTFETSPQIGVVSLIRKDDKSFAIEGFRSGGRLKMSGAGSFFVVKVTHPGTFQVVRLKSSPFPESTKPSPQEPRKSR